MSVSLTYQNRRFGLIDQIEIYQLQLFTYTMLVSTNQKRRFNSLIDQIECSSASIIHTKNMSVSLTIKKSRLSLID